MEDSIPEEACSEANLVSLKGAQKSILRLGVKKLGYKFVETRSSSTFEGYGTNFEESSPIEQGLKHMIDRRVKLIKR